jgi:hypothetical protein
MDVRLEIHSFSTSVQFSSYNTHPPLFYLQQSFQRLDSASVCVCLSETGSSVGLT